MSDKLCVFCIENNLLKVPIWYEDDTWVIVGLEEGSSNRALMVITKRHVETPFEMNQSEWSKLGAMVIKAKDIIDQKEAPDGYNIGWNVGEVGGQHVFHAHLHVLARYADEPLSGTGIRHVFKQAENQRPNFKR